MDTLQFQKAEFSSDGPKCAACRASTESEYYELLPKPIKGRFARSTFTPVVAYELCSNCAAQIKDFQAAPSHSVYLRGILYGAGMALLCAIGYSAIILAINMEFALIAILVGYLVGTAVRKGTNGLGGRRCQIAAVALTYLAITFSYVPVSIKQYVDQQKQAAAAHADKKAATPSTESPKNPIPATAGPIKAGLLIEGVLLLIALAMASPLFNLQTGLGGILGLVIIFFGLQRAWRLTARDPRVLRGPYEREASDEGAAASNMLVPMIGTAMLGTAGAEPVA